MRYPEEPFLFDLVAQLDPSSPGPGSSALSLPLTWIQHVRTSEVDVIVEAFYLFSSPPSTFTEQGKAFETCRAREFTELWCAYRGSDLYTGTRHPLSRYHKRCLHTARGSPEFTTWTMN